MCRLVFAPNIPFGIMAKRFNFGFIRTYFPKILLGDFKCVFAKLSRASLFFLAGEGFRLVTQPRSPDVWEIWEILVTCTTQTEPARNSCSRRPLGSLPDQLPSRPLAGFRGTSSSQRRQCCAIFSRSDDDWLSSRWSTVRLLPWRVIRSLLLRSLRCSRSSLWGKRSRKASWNSWTLFGVNQTQAERDWSILNTARTPVLRGCAHLRSLFTLHTEDLSFFLHWVGQITGHGQSFTQTWCLNGGLLTLCIHCVLGETLYKELCSKE